MHVKPPIPTWWANGKENTCVTTVEEKRKSEAETQKISMLSQTH